MKSVLPRKKPTMPKSSGNKFFDARQRLLAVEKNRKAGNLQPALKECKELLKQFPDFVGALFNIGLIYAKLGDSKNAIFNLSYAVGLDPQNLPIRVALAKTHEDNGSFEMAQSILVKLEEEFPDNSNVLTALGRVLNKSQEFESSLVKLNRALEIDSENTETWKEKSFALVEMGNSAEAVLTMQNAVKSGGLDMTALFYLSKLPNELVEMDLMQNFEVVDSKVTSRNDDFLARRGFALANIQFSKGDLREGWKSLQKANEIKFSELKSENKSSENVISALYSALEKAPVLRNLGKHTQGVPKTVFIFGPSRSGKSTLEKLMGGFPSVSRGFESSIIKETALKTSAKSGLPNREFAFQLPPALDSVFRSLYVQDLTNRIGDKDTFTVTTPGRILDAYQLARSVPNLKFIFIKRDVEDTVYSMYNNFYSTANAHTYNLDAAREHVTAYYKMQDKLTELLPGITMTITYEDMVQDTIGTLKSVQKFCGLEGEIGKLPDIGDDRGYAQKFKHL